MCLTALAASIIDAVLGKQSQLARHRLGVLGADGLSSDLALWRAWLGNAEQHRTSMLCLVLGVQPGLLDLGQRN